MCSFFFEFADGRSETSPDSENTEFTKPKAHKRGYSSVEQIQFNKSRGMSAAKDEQQ